MNKANEPKSFTSRIYERRKSSATLPKEVDTAIECVSDRAKGSLFCRSCSTQNIIKKYILYKLNR